MTVRELIAELERVEDDGRLVLFGPLLATVAEVRGAIESAADWVELVPEDEEER